MANHRKTFTHIYEEHINKIFRFIFLKIGAEDTTKDLCSEVFVRTWDTINKGTVIKNPQAFLYKVAKNLVAEHYRKNSKIKMVSLDNCKEINDPNSDIEKKALLRSDLNTVQKALCNIKQDYQDVVILHYLDELSISEIAEVLEKSNGAVRVMLHRGLKSLRNKLS